MRFVTITHPQLGTARVPAVRVPHLSPDWTVTVLELPAGGEPAAATVVDLTHVDDDSVNGDAGTDEPDTTSLPSISL
jgi:hypothetical protein